MDGGCSAESIRAAFTESEMLDDSGAVEKESAD